MSLFNNYVPFKEELEKYIGHCKTVFDEIGDRTTSTLIEGFVKDLDSQRYNITILGSMKRGKSTLLNAMMERKNDSISPISSQVCTSAIVKYMDKNISNTEMKKEEAVIHFKNPEQQAVRIPLLRLADYVTEDKNPKNRKNVHSVEVFGDFPDWSKAVTIIDSPGYGSVFAHHDTLLADFLPYTDAIIFLVAADIPLDGGDIALLKELSAEEKKKIFFVLTKVDNIDNPDDLEDVIDFVKNKIEAEGLTCDKLYTVSAKPVYEALCSGITGTELENRKAENGLLELEGDLERFIVAESDQTKILRDRIEMLLKKTSEACNSYIKTSEDLMSMKTYDLTKLQSEERELQDANKVLKENTKKALKKFSRDWSKALSSFQRKFASKASAIDDRIMDDLGRGGLIGAVFQSFKLKQQIQRVIGLELQPLIIDMEEKLATVIKTLSEELDDELSLYVRQKSKTDAVAAVGSLLALSATGGTAAFGIHATTVAVQSATTAFHAWQGATAAATIATVETTTTSVGIFGKIGAWLFGSEKAAEAAIAAGHAGNAGSAALVAGVSAVVTAGVSIVVMLIVQKLLHIGLVKFQEGRVPNITEGIMKEMEDKLFKSLESYKDSVVKDYEERIDDLLNDNLERLDTVKALIASDNSAEERALTTERLVKVKGLLEAGIHVQKQIPLLG